MENQRVENGAPLGVLVVGAAGRLGQRACHWLEEDPSFLVLERLGRGECNPARLAASAAQLGLDLSLAGLGAPHGLMMLEAGLRPVIGTSGVSLEENAELDAAARELKLGGLVVPNFSLGMWLLQRAALQATPYFPRAEIVETHHSHKRDRPSGSALHTAEQMAAEGQGRQMESIPIHSLRLPGALAKQEVVFGGPGELLRIVHETSSLEVYSRGLRLCLRYASRALGVGRGLGLALESPHDSSTEADSLGPHA